MTSERVNVDNFVRAESNLAFGRIAADAGGVGKWAHYRQVSPIDHQTIIRLNRDTLYSAAIVDISEGADLVVPDTSGRYLSVMVVNQDHYINRIFHDPGTYHLTTAEFDTDYVLLAARILVDPEDADDLAVVHSLQDQLELRADANRPLNVPDYDIASLGSTREALLELARGIPGFSRSFGRREEVDPVRWLLGAAAGWGGLPEYEAFYANVDPGLPVGEYQLTVGDVPVDAFWSISLYNAAGYYERNDRNSYTVSSVTADRNDDGTVTVHFGNADDDAPNRLPIMEGWNYLVRFYQPHAEVLDGSYRFPDVSAVD